MHSPEGVPSAGINPHARSPAGLRALIASFWRHRGLILQLSRREVIGRYRGSVAGLAWSFFNPILMLAVYTFVFSIVFEARWDRSLGDGRFSFAIVLFVGVIVHGLLAECILRAPSLILANVNYVKKVVFPLETLAWVTTSSALFHAGVSIAVLLIAQLLSGAGIPWTVALLPIVLAPLTLVGLGITWLFAALGVYLRDLSQMVGLLATVLLFLAPVFYPLSALPEPYRSWIELNPLTLIIEQAREVLLAGRLPDFGALAGYAFVAATFASLAFWFFQRARKGFADVL